jgi:DNA-binding NarL/FixJ family response regulator
MALVLIVDDSPTQVHALRSALERHGFEIETAVDGNDGVEKARRLHPDLILMDVITFLLDEPVQTLEGARVLVASHRQIPAGLIVDEVYGFRRLTESQRRGVNIDALPARVRPCVEDGFWLEDRVWPVVRLRALIESETFLDPAV